ncbi:hypothetical protein A8L45_05535 [Veronia pacifica]|uniref:Succinylglutamate desuccinylase n=1 Tax=Veronia pacifica TaxID=1080227 RepID=A0A1C3EPP6_9GAMM|nr:hypothetical protein A8L45_05535 [Veronia pacifica]
MKMHDVFLPDEQQRSAGMMAWLRSLPGPVWMTMKGKDDSRHRIVVTLLHGNEPSGLRAIWELFSCPPACAVTTHFCIANVDAALEQPEFSFRHLDDKPDLNRCFGRPGNCLSYHLARDIEERIQALTPEAVVDLHNTSGSSPSFAVSLSDDSEHKAIASLFTERFLHTSVHLGALMELSSPELPIVTIECGGVNDNTSDITALDGLQRFLTKVNIRRARPKVNLDVLHNPVRVKLVPGSTICYHSRQVGGVDLIMAKDVDKHNFGLLKAGTQIGWLGEAKLNCLSVTNGGQQCSVSDYFKCQKGKLVLKKDSQLFMITTNPKIAIEDCLFYLVPDKSE